MDTKWFEDFMSLAETRSFSRSAQLRHITQSAFSRRMQSLECWAGVQLIDRVKAPPKLTAAGEALYRQCVEMLHVVQATRNMLKSYASKPTDAVEFVMPTSLAINFFPNWMSDMMSSLGAISTRVAVMNVHEAEIRLKDGRADFLIAYSHPAMPVALNEFDFEMVVLSQECFAPYTATTGAGLPKYTLPGEPRRCVPFLGYAAGTYLARLSDVAITNSKRPVHLKHLYETSTAEGLKAMVLKGHGVAFLPKSCVAEHLQSGELLKAHRSGENCPQENIEIRMYRSKSGRHLGGDCAKSRRNVEDQHLAATLNTIWATSTS